MRLLLTGLTAGVLVLSACAAPAATLPSPTATVAATSTPTPTPVNKFVFLADLKTSNEVPAIANAEATCTGKGTFTLNTTKDATGTITGATALFETDVTGCPAGTEINIGHIHKEVAGKNGGVVVNSGLAKGELVLTGGAGKINKTATVVDAGGLTAAALAADIIANPANYYMNWHSTANAGGVIRGQLTRQP
ncbi:MAG TPA: CHRD domain-containing protein [Candidatus Limnocylindria bacterium]